MFLITKYLKIKDKLFLNAKSDLTAITYSDAQSSSKGQRCDKHSYFRLAHLTQPNESVPSLSLNCNS